MTTAKQYDYLNRLTSISSTGGAGSASPAAFNYTYNAANQRVSSTLTDGSYWVYGYDSLGQVTNANKYWVDRTPVAGQQFDYAFDTIGNRTQTQSGGDQNGANLRVANYTNNLLNQIISRDAPGYVDVMGLGFATNAVTVNGQTAYRKGEYFRQQLSVANSSAAVWQGVTNASGPASVTGHVFVPQTPQNYGYDADGNLLRDGQWAYIWDAENRLVQMHSLSGAPTGSKLQLSFAYDYQGRRIQKVVSTNNGSGYVGEYTNNYAYDRWNCIAILNPSLSLVDSLLWGTDLSGSMQGAGGVGGLLALTYYGSATTNCFVAYDGNGNVSALIGAANGTAVANYEYGPFGEVVRSTGPMAKVNPFRFSTKYQDDESDLIMYPYRPYKASTGTWPSRDPINEVGFEILTRVPASSTNFSDLYGFVGNNPLMYYDTLGLCCGCKYKYPCAEAKARGLDHGDEGGVVCCGGQAFACFFGFHTSYPTGPGTQTAKRLIEQCILAHETIHTHQGKCPCCDLCRKPYNVDQNTDECEAYYGEMNCLLASMSQCGGDPLCIADIKSELAGVFQFISQYCKGHYPSQ